MADVPRLQKVVPLIEQPLLMLRLVFSGSFQCRLATEGDGTDHKPTDKKGVYGEISVGQTFAYREKEFDRVILFSRPVQLRNALLDPWEDVKVTLVEVNTTRTKLSLGGGKVSPTGDVLMGQVVSLGKARFDTNLGMSLGAKEAITGLSLNIGGGMLTADSAAPPLNKTRTDIKQWAQDYVTRKSQALERIGSQMDPVRRAYLSEIRDSDGELKNINESAYEFYQMGAYVGPLKNVRCNVQSKFNPKNWIDIPFNWTIDLTFFRYDHDTLTGRVEGQVYATAAN